MLLAEDRAAATCRTQTLGKFVLRQVERDSSGRVSSVQEREEASGERLRSPRGCAENRRQTQLWPLATGV